MSLTNITNTNHFLSNYETFARMRIDSIGPMESMLLRANVS